MGNQFIVIKEGGRKTSVMAREQVVKYIKNMLDNVSGQNRYGCLSEALSNIMSCTEEVKVGGEVTFKGHDVKHVSTGKKVNQCITIFYYDDDGVHYIVGVGKQRGSNDYKLDVYGCGVGRFYRDKVISLN